jgi:hypothetical protein
VPVGARLAAAARARADVGLLDAPPVDINLGEQPAIAVLAVGLQADIAGADQRLQAALGRRAAGLVELGGIDVGQADLLAAADQRVAVDRQTALACSRSASEQQAKRQKQE